MKANKKSDLKPCPFCGGEARLDGTGTYSIILCSNCGAKSKKINIAREYCADEKPLKLGTGGLTMCRRLSTGSGKR